MSEKQEVSSKNQEARGRTSSAVARPTGSPQVNKIPPSQIIHKQPSGGGSNSHSFMQLVARALIIFGIGFLGGWVSWQVNDEPSASIVRDAGEQVVLQESELITSIAKRVGESVVSINVESQQQSFFGGSFSSESAGTGIILSEDGYLVTNKHVIPDNTTGVSITLSDGTTYDDIEVAGRDPFNDIAYLKVNGVSDLTPVTLGDSSEVEVGEKVVAIGNALGEFSNTVTSGIISGVSRPIVAGDGAGAGDSLQNLFQTDASINPGNSGGPLVNASGQVIGINTAVAGNAENIGFAIPINDVRSGIETVLSEGELIKPYVGVRYVTITPEIAEALNLPVEQGAYLDSSIESGRSVVADSPAEKAGLREGDIIVKADGQDITADVPLGSLVARFKVGDTVPLTVLRAGEEIVIDVVLERVPEDL